MRTMTSLGLILVLASSAAFAADQVTTKPAADCSSLEKQFDTAKKDQVPAEKLKNAQKQRAQGSELCMKGETAEGMKALKNALADIGVH
jgi:Skp family chaperone for outer membrane proteins